MDQPYCGEQLLGPEADCPSYWDGRAKEAMRCRDPMRARMLRSYANWLRAPAVLREPLAVLREVFSGGGLH